MWGLVGGCFYLLQKAIWKYTVEFLQKKSQKEKTFAMDLRVSPSSHENQIPNM